LNLHILSRAVSEGRIIGTPGIPERLARAIRRLIGNPIPNEEPITLDSIQDAKLRELIEHQSTSGSWTPAAVRGKAMTTKSRVLGVRSSAEVAVPEGATGTILDCAMPPGLVRLRLDDPWGQELESIHLSRDMVFWKEELDVAS